MGDLENEFKGKMPDWAEALLNKKPSELDAIIDTDIDTITNLAEAKTFLRKYIKRIVRVLWFYGQMEIVNR